MKTTLLIRDIFKLSNGVTVLACDSTTTLSLPLIAKTGLIHAADVVRQSITFIGIRHMLRQSLPSTSIGIETNEIINLSIAEAQSGLWHLSIDQ